MTDSSPTAPPATANTGAIAAMGLELQEGRRIPRKQIVSWAFWDWSTQPFNSVILTFVFTALYLTTDAFVSPEIAALPAKDPRHVAALAELASGLGLAGAVAGFLIFLFAPVMGQRSDRGHRKRWLAINTYVLVACMLGLFFVESKPGLFFVLGVSLIAVGSVFSEIAGVNYNAMLVQVSTPKTVGKVSGLGWGFGYLGGIVALGIVIVAYAFHWFGLSTDDGLPFRLVAVGCAIWTVLFSLPIFLNVPEIPPAPASTPRVGFLRSYVVLVRDVMRLWRESRTTFWFLLASAVFRDGLAGVFTYGAVIASVVFGFGFIQVVIFGIAANLVAGVSTILSGRLDDRFGPRAVIIGSLIGLLVSGLAVFFLRDAGDLVFWIFGLALCLFVGPAQSASRSFLARVTPAGHEGEIFGLYATTGRAASFLSQSLWTLFIALLGATFWGILGILIVLAAGLVLMLLVRLPEDAPGAPGRRRSAGREG
jgi:UMF1 family MFS transporter